MSKLHILKTNWHDSKIASFADHNLNYSTTEYTYIMFLASLKAYVFVHEKEKYTIWWKLNGEYIESSNSDHLEAQQFIYIHLLSPSYSFFTAKWIGS